MDVKNASLNYLNSLQGLFGYLLKKLIPAIYFIQWVSKSEDIYVIDIEDYDHTFDYNLREKIT